MGSKVSFRYIDVDVILFLLFSVSFSSFCLDSFNRSMCMRPDDSHTQLQVVCMFVCLFVLQVVVGQTIGLIMSHHLGAVGNVLDYQSDLPQLCLPACGHKGFSQLSPVLAYDLYRDASSTLFTRRVGLV